MWALMFFIMLPIAVIFGLLLPVFAIIDIIRSKFEGNDAVLFALIVIFIPFGAIIYFLIGSSKKIS